MADRGFLVTWGLFRALETALDGDGLPDRTVDDLYEAALEEIGCGGLHEGWHLVATQLRQSLIHHAEELGCDCGSLQWLEREQLGRAADVPDA